MQKIAVILFSVLLSVNLYSQDNNTAVPFTLGDRDRLMRNEQKIENIRTEINALRIEMNVKFESVDKQFSSVQKQIDIIITLLFFVLGGLASLIGFVIYDRRTAIKPVQRKQDTLEDILVEYSKENKKLRDILKNAGIL